MSARAGGEADKFGLRYEGIWTVYHVLQVLDGSADSISVERPGELGEGVEFVVRRGSSTEVHQVKLQDGSNASWTPMGLQAKGILASAKSHAQRGRDFHFVSTIPSPVMKKLANRAQHSIDFVDFTTQMMDGKGVETEWKSFCSLSPFKQDNEGAWETLRRMHIHCEDEAAALSRNAMLAGLYLEGATPRAMAALLGDMVIHNLGDMLDAATIEGFLQSEYGLRRARLIGSQSLAQDLRKSFHSWKATIDHELLRPTIPRSDAATIEEKFAGDGRIVFLLGAAGRGKSAVLHQVVSGFEDQDWPVFGLRLDRIEPFSSTTELGHRLLGLDRSPATALAACSIDRPSLLVIDQLDAVSKAAGRMPTVFDQVAELLHESQAAPEMRVLVACRRFDFDNDDRIKSLAERYGVEVVEINPLSDGEAAGAVQDMGLPWESMSRTQQILLREPLNLKLLRAVADKEGALNFATSTHLFDKFVETKQVECNLVRSRTVHFWDVLYRMAQKMSDGQTLEVSRSAFDKDDLTSDADIMASAQVITYDNRNRAAFFHESLFDYVFTRQWLNRNESLVEFLMLGKQELFRRAQVRVILQRLREEDFPRYIEELEGLLAHDDVRFHIKHVVLALLRGLESPSAEEWEVLERLLDAGVVFKDHITLLIRTAPWFDFLDRDGLADEWLANGDGPEDPRVFSLLVAGAKGQPDRLAEILGRYEGQAENYRVWLSNAVQFSDLHASRPLFELLIAAVRRGDYRGREQWLFVVCHSLGEQQPGWATELVAAYLSDRLRVMEREPETWVIPNEMQDIGVAELVRRGAAGAPEQYCEGVVPLLLDLMAVGAIEREGRPIFDRFSLGWHPDLGDRAVVGALMDGAVTALRARAADTPDTLRPLLERLALSPYWGAQRLLYETLVVAGPYYAEWTAEVLFQGDYRLSNGPAARVIEVISSQISIDTHVRLERAALDFLPDWEQSEGYNSFLLLGSLDGSRLSPDARSRLDALQDRFRDFFPPTIEQELSQARLMSTVSVETAANRSDDEWLAEIEALSASAVSSDQTGPAYEAAYQFRQLTQEDPSRFARMTLRMGGATHPAFFDAVLLALQEKSPERVDLELVCDVIRHVAATGSSENRRWLAAPLDHRFDEALPLATIELLLKLAQETDDPPVDDIIPDENIVEHGLATARGHLAFMLGNILVHDPTGSRTAIVAPALSRLAEDPSVAVRSCVAHTIAGCLQHAESTAFEAFELLIESDDRLFASPLVERLILYVGYRDVSRVEGVLARMLASQWESVRETGGRLAAWAALEMGLEDLLSQAKTSDDPAIRKGVATICAGGLAVSTNSKKAANVLGTFFNDDDRAVLAASAEVAYALRGQRLRPFRTLLQGLIDSRSFEAAVSQLLITLESAPDRSERLELLCIRRYIEHFGAGIADMRTSAAGDAVKAGEILVRACVQTQGRADHVEALDLLDRLLLVGAYGLAEKVEMVERDIK